MKDLHIHTKYSDGEFDENEILEKIISAGITEFAICDHDTIEGSMKVCEKIKQLNLDIIFHSGIEITSRINDIFDGISVHLLVRDFQFDDKVILDAISIMKRNRLKNLDLMLEGVKKDYNVEIPKQRIEEVLKETNSIGEPHVYKLLCEIKNIDETYFYDKTIKNLKTEHLKIDAAWLLENFKGHQGYITLAHPIKIMKDYNFSYADIEKIVEHLHGYGLKGLEVEYSKHTKKDIAEFSKIADKFNLIKTPGSDFHGPNVKPNRFLGVCQKQDS
ncbi:hypothetical protein CCY99_01130 [Helicobacter sp. 16-1353]|uniref:PHP domain-containing protein n=1 Tax=Helicobacter sp. 16-1353 TaxID=2004996 RepID=UPI000DCAE41D|nr:PHP domain-containing protein [Helicobacter sp. 16-1353]RAX55331.1 hypothetical protein CCY99_01130 [Helicobacter sp. 16-1353]